MNIVCKKFVDLFNDEYLMVFEQGKFAKPILMLDKNDIKRINEEFTSGELH
jgi:hypothetical protein